MPECGECQRLGKRNRQLKNQFITAKTKLMNCRLEIKKLKKQSEENRPGKSYAQKSCLRGKIPVTNIPFLRNVLSGIEVPPDNIVDHEDQEQNDDHEHEETESLPDETTEEEPDFSSDGYHETETDTDTASEQEDDLDTAGDRCI